MKPTPPNSLFCAIALLLTSAHFSQVHARLIFFSWWEPLYQTPGLFSQAQGGYSREAKLPDEDPIQDLVSHSITKTNQELVSVLVMPKGSAIVDPDAFTGRAQTGFGENHAQTQTILTGFGESADRNYYDRRQHSMFAQSLWSDRWTFTGPGVGTSPVTLNATINFEITSSPCVTGNCGQVANPIFTRTGIADWGYRIYGSIRVFDLDIIDDLFMPDRDFTEDVPREIAAFEVFQQGSARKQEILIDLEPYGAIPNKRLSPIHTNGVVKFVPVPGHRYAIIGHINMQSDNGGDIDVGTIQLNSIELGNGLRLQSFGETNGAQYKVLSSTRIAASPAINGSLSLSFPTTTGFTYYLEARDTLGASGWNVIATKAGNDQTQTVTDNEGIPSKTAQFYRLRIE